MPSCKHCDLGINFQRDAEHLRRGTIIVRGLETPSCDLACLICRREDEGGQALCLQEGRQVDVGYLLCGCQGQ